jgi:hypothetical protein
MELQMPGKSLRSTLLGFVGALSIATSAHGEEQEIYQHPAEPAESPAQATASNAFDFAVPLLERASPHPSYGPAPPEGASDPVAEMQGMMEMDHSAHQMPGDDMPGMDHSAMPENVQ